MMKAATTSKESMSPNIPIKESRQFSLSTHKKKVFWDGCVLKYSLLGKFMKSKGI